MGNPFDGVKSNYKKSDYTGYFGFLIRKDIRFHTDRLVGCINEHDNTRVIFYNATTEDTGDTRIKMHPSDKRLLTAFKDWSSQTEMLGNVKFFDMNDLSEENKKYLSKNKITVPERPDLIVGYSHKKHFADHDVLGFYLKYDDSTTAYIAMRNNKKLVPGKFPYLAVGHEVGHAVGLEHLHGSTDDIVKTVEKKSYILDSNAKLIFDNLDNTIMTYQHFYKKDYVRAGKFRTTFEELDQKAIKTIQGKSLMGIDYQHDIKEPRDAVYAKSHFKVCVERIGEFLGVSKHDAKKMLDETKVNNNVAIPIKANRELEFLKN